MRDLLNKSSEFLFKTRKGTLLSLSLILIWSFFIIINYFRKAWKSDIFKEINLPVLPDLSNLPYLNEAIVRTGLSIAGALILLISAAILGNFILKSLKCTFKVSNESLIFSIAAGIGTLAYIGFLLALAGWYRIEILRIIVSIPISAGILFQLIIGGKVLPGFKTRSFAKKELLWWFCAGTAILFALIAALAPETEFDALWYHLAYPQRYLDSGNLIDLPQDYVSLYPMTFELWFGYGLAFGGQITAKLLHFACLPLTGLAIIGFVRRFFPGISPALTVALFVTIPTVIWEASTAYIDLALTFYILIMLYALFVYHEEGNQSWLTVAAINMGLALALKHLSLIVLFLACAVVVVHNLSEKRSIRYTIFQISFFCCISLAIAMPWYIRSILATGNPFFPELYSVFGAPPERWNTATQKGLQNFLNHFGPQRTIRNYLLLPWHLTIHSSKFDGSLGPVFLILLPLLIFVKEKTKFLYLLSGFILLYFIIWASPLSSFQMRFLIPVTSILAILGASAFTAINNLARSFSKVLQFFLNAGLALLLIINMPPFTALHEHDRTGWQNWLTSVLRYTDLNIILGGESEVSYLSRSIASYGVWNFANNNIPENAFVLTCSNGDQFYSKRERIWIYSTYARSVTNVTEEAGAVNELRKSGITHLIHDKRDKYTLEMKIFSPAVINTIYEKLYEDRFYVLYQLR